MIGNLYRLICSTLGSPQVNKVVIPEWLQAVHIHSRSLRSAKHTVQQYEQQCMVPHASRRVEIYSPNQTPSLGCTEHR